MKRLLLAIALISLAYSGTAEDRLNLEFGSEASNGHVTILADSAEFLGSGDEFLFKGNVEVIQGDVVFRSGEVGAYLAEDRSKLDIVRAIGGASMEWPNGSALADNATYKVGEGLIGFYGNLEVTTDDGRLAGYGLVYDVNNDLGKILNEQEFEETFGSDE